MFTKKELAMINQVLSQLQFRAGQGDQLKLAEDIMKKISKKFGAEETETEGKSGK